MEQVAMIMPNKKTGKMYVPTSNGNWFRVQVQSTGMIERDGFFRQQNLVGFAYFATEDMARVFIASAVDGKVPGKVVYVDQLNPIVEERENYGKVYPWPATFNGKQLEPAVKAQVQAKAIETGLSLMQSGKAIYRKKMYTTDITKQSVILSPDNQDDINVFVAGVLSSSGTSAEDKAARINQLKSVPKAKRTPEQVTELAELLED